MNDIIWWIGVGTLVHWAYKVFYWYFIIDRSGNTGRYKHYLED